MQACLTRVPSCGECGRILRSPSIQRRVRTDRCTRRPFQTVRNLIAVLIDHVAYISGAGHRATGERTTPGWASTEADITSARELGDAEKRESNRRSKRLPGKKVVRIRPGCIASGRRGVFASAAQFTTVQ